MRCLLFTLCVLSLLLASCNPKRNPLAEYEKEAALREAQELIHRDTDMVIPQWYRSGLSPSYSTYEETKPGGFLKRAQLFVRAKPAIRPSPLWKLLGFCAVLYLITPAILAFAPPPPIDWILKQTGVREDAKESAFFELLFLNVLVFVASFALIFPVKLVSQAFLTGDRYIPWHFIVHIINLLYVIGVSGLAAYALVTLVVPKEVLEGPNRLLKGIAQKKRERADAEELLRQKMRQHREDLRSYSSLLTGEEDDGVILESIHATLDAILDINKTHKYLIGEYKSDIALVLEHMESKGYGTDMTAQRFRRILATN